MILRADMREKAQLFIQRTLMDAGFSKRGQALHRTMSDADIVMSMPSIDVRLRMEPATIVFVKEPLCHDGWGTVVRDGARGPKRGVIGVCEVVSVEDGDVTIRPISGRALLLNGKGRHLGENEWTDISVRNSAILAVLESEDEDVGSLLPG